MKILTLSLLLSIFAFPSLFSQNTLFDNSRVSSVYIDISQDSLNWIMANVYSDHYCKARFIYDDGTKRDTLQDAGFRLRGNTSRVSKKKSFKISFNEYVSGRRYQNVKKINLNGEHNDPTLIREKLFYDCWKSAGLAERRTSFVKVFINQVYYGLYTNLEEYDKDWLQRVYGEKNGNLYKCTYPADLVYQGSDPQTYKNIGSGSTTGGRAYDLQTNETADDYTDLIDLIAMLDKPADASFAAAIAGKVNIDNLLKAFALDVATGNWDDYMYNKNNYFLYHSPVSGKFEFLAYDTDNTFGVDWVNRDWATRDCMDWVSHSEARPLVVKILTVPEFNVKYQRYLDTIAREIINPAILFQHIDALKAMVADAALADTYRTLDWGYTLADFNNGYNSTIDGHTPYGIKPFLTTRYARILQQLPANTPLAETDRAENEIVLFPNPVSEFVTLKLLASPHNRAGFIQDISGKRQVEIVVPANQSECRIAVLGLAPGIYNLVIQNADGVVSRKFIRK